VLTYLRNLQNERDSLTAAATQITETAASESRDVTESERASIVTMGERCAVIDGQLETFGAQLDSQRHYAALRASLSERGADDEPPDRAPVRAPERPVEARGWAALFTESPEFRSWRGSGSTGRVEVPGIFTRAPIQMVPPSADGFPGLVDKFRWQNPQPLQTTPLLDACGNVTTNSNVVEWFDDEPPGYPLAQVVPEAQPKPEADFTIVPKTGTLQTYAHWKSITRQALSNIPMIQSIVENKLRGGIFAKLEADVIAALDAATLTTVDPSGTNGMLGAIRNALGEAQSQGFPNANTVVLNPMDWAGLDISVMIESVDGPRPQSQYWGLRVISSAQVPAGTAYVGDLNTGVTVFDQGTASVFMSDSHASNFISNILVILAETMALPLVTQAAALVKVEAPAGP
jgi:HK97 family phage major capsid protein